MTDQKLDEIIIAKVEKPIQKPAQPTSIQSRRPGILKGKIRIADDFDAPLTNDIFLDPK